MEAAEEHQPDFSHLPTDALCVVLQQLFAPAPGESAVPLSQFICRWQAVASVCTTWRDVLLAHPPPLYLAISTLPEAWVPWLLSLPVHALCAERGLDAAWTQPEDSDEDEEVEAWAAEDGAPGPPAGMPAPLPALHLISGLEGSGLPQPFWSLAALPRLRVLHLQAPVHSLLGPLEHPEHPEPVFDGRAAGLERLQQLEELSLGSWAQYRLQALPHSLRRLRLRYTAQRRTLSVPQLPEEASLDLLCVEKPNGGALGLPMADLWGRVRRLEVHAVELLIGVPVEDKRLVATFARPYKEGMFVPPHIWGDEEADDNSKAAADLASRHFLATLPACPALEALRLLGPCAASPKFMPVLQQGGSEALAWLWSVVRERGLHHQFGLSGREMRERQQLFGDSLRIGHGSAAQPRAGVAGAAAPGAGQPWCCIEVVRDGREAAGPE